MAGFLVHADDRQVSLCVFRLLKPSHRLRGPPQSSRRERYPVRRFRMSHVDVRRILSLAVVSRQPSATHHPWSSGTRRHPQQVSSAVSPDRLFIQRLAYVLKLPSSDKVGRISCLGSAFEPVDVVSCGRRLRLPVDRISSGSSRSHRPRPRSSSPPVLALLGTVIWGFHRAFGALVPERTGLASSPRCGLMWWTTVALQAYLRQAHAAQGMISKKAT